MDKLPFAPYDFFGYIASGFALLAGIQLAFGFPPVLGKSQTVTDSLFLLLAVYVVGHVIAMPAKAIWEDLLAKRILKAPSVNLFRDKKPFIRGLLFPGYYKPLPAQIRKVVRERAESEGMHEDGEDLFTHVRYWPDVRTDEKLISRLDSFRNQYGFSRNLSFTSLIIAGILLSRAQILGNGEMRSYGVAAAILAVALLYRYLKFFRQYSYEMFNSYRPKMQGRII